MRGRFLFEIRPDLFPEGCLTAGEIQLWGKYYDQRARDRKARDAKVDAAWPT